MLQEAAILVLPSQSETFGLVILEAWAAGTAVIASRTSGATALIRHGANGWLFDLDDRAGFHRALAEALSNPQATGEMVSRGAQLVREEYGIGKLAAQLKGVYEQAVEEYRCAT